VSDVSGVESNDQSAKLRLLEPQRYLTTQDAAFWLTAFAGDDQDVFRVVGLSSAEKARKRRVSLRLRHPMQIDARIDRIAAACKFLPRAPIDRRQPRWRGRRRRGCG
jgi:hypothetical protein